MKNKISVVTTFRNEQDVLPEFLHRTRAALAALPQYDYEICFVDDDSTDSSTDILRREIDKDPYLRLIVTSRRFGVYPCLIAGLESATGDAVIYLETDLQDPPELIPKLVRKWEEGFDVVYTTRKHRAGENAIKMAIVAWAYRVIDSLSQIRIPHNSGDYKLLSRRALVALVSISERDPYFRGMVSWVGFKQAQIFYEREPRQAGKSKRSLLTLAPLQVFLSAILSFSNKPLYFVALLALALTVGGIAASLGTFFLDRSWNERLLFAFLVMMTTVIQLSLGVLALYFSRICTEIRHWPIYLVRERAGFPLEEVSINGLKRRCLREVGSN